MPIIDNRTPNLNLPLPNVDNALEDDVARIRSAFGTLDTVVSGHATTLGTKADLVAGKVPSAQLPSFVDDVLEYANAAALPGTGEAGKIYVTLDNNKTHRWGGSAYVEISASPGSTDSVTEGATNLYFTPARVLAAVLTGLSTATSTAVTATDTVLQAIGKLQAKITAMATQLGSTAQGMPFTEVEITPGSNGQTSFAVSGGYTAGQVWVLLNGVKLAASDFTASDGSNIVLADGVSTSDRLTVVRWKSALVA